MAEPVELLLTSRDQVWLVLGLGGVLCGGIMVGAGTTLFARWWVEREDQDAIRRARK